ncbi:hypothetical protein OK016_08890 [Vibrio chagasii]|nr:hypothetical protein [Vibrio chagasii]
MKSPSCDLLGNATGSTKLVVDRNDQHLGEDTLPDAILFRAVIITVTQVKANERCSRSD